ncbi:DUF2721 domain-containing protein [Prosthecomicrobium sp. N25]|uniref:DUF2721 domain-containing protein n=1 Tax=Prosthecomicrobium sp. N25 TaxID=3129254 RepID=UPI003076D3DC
MGEVGLDALPDLDRLAHIFSNAAAPAFFLGAVAAFVSLMNSRLSALSQRLEAVRAETVENKWAAERADRLRSLEVRAVILGKGILFALASGICATLLLAVLFGAQFLGLHHGYGAALLFLIATVLLGAGLYRFGEEAWLAYTEIAAEVAKSRSVMRESPAARGSKPAAMAGPDEPDPL